MLFYGWQEKKQEEYELLKSMSILTGSFYNPEAAKEMLKKDSAQFSSSDEDFEKSLKMVEDDIKNTRRRKRKIINKDLSG